MKRGILIVIAVLAMLALALLIRGANKQPESEPEQIAETEPADTADQDAGEAPAGSETTNDPSEENNDFAPLEIEEEYVVEVDEDAGYAGAIG